MEGAHISRSIPVTRLKGTNQLNVVTFMFFAIGNHFEAVKEYYEIVEFVKKIMKEIQEK